MAQQNYIGWSDRTQGFSAIKMQMEHRQLAKFTWKGNLGSGKVYSLFQGLLKNTARSTSSIGTGNVYFCNDFI